MTDPRRQKDDPRRQKDDPRQQNNDARRQNNDPRGQKNNIPLSNRWPVNYPVPQPAKPSTITYDTPFHQLGPVFHPMPVEYPNNNTTNNNNNIKEEASSSSFFGHRSGQNLYHPNRDPRSSKKAHKLLKAQPQNAKTAASSGQSLSFEQPAAQTPAEIKHMLLMFLLSLPGASKRGLGRQ